MLCWPQPASIGALVFRGGLPRELLVAPGNDVHQSGLQARGERGGVFVPLIGDTRWAGKAGLLGVDVLRLRRLELMDGIDRAC